MIGVGGEQVGKHDDRLVIRIKAVPGASRECVAGMLGDRVKVRVQAAAEGGKANKAILGLLARSLGVPRARVELVSGQTNPEKVVAIRSMTPAEANAALGFAIDDAVTGRGTGH